jgi:hypothetical protein
MGPITSRFLVGPTNPQAAFTMAFICGRCGEPGLAYGNDARGLYVGQCAGGDEVTIMAS